jgi:hypothetical protein
MFLKERLLTMRDKFLHKGMCCVLMMAAGLLQACSIMDTSTTDCDNSTTVTFTIQVEKGAGAATRADNPTWGDSYTSDATTYDVDIDTETVQVFLLDADDKTVDIRKVRCFMESEGVYRYYGEVAADGLTDGETYRCMVVANAGTSAIDYSALKQTTIAASTLPATTDASYQLPMWGVGSFKAKVGQRQELDAIYMLRSVAKCRVKLASSLTDYTLSNVSLTNCSSSANLLPAKPDVESTRALSTDAETDGSYNPVSGTNTASATLFAEPDKDNSLICYIPESDNSSAMELTLTKDGGAARTFTVDITPQSTALTTPIPRFIRNHVYDFEVTGIKNGTMLTLSVKDWNVTDEVTLDYADNISYSEGLKWKNYSIMNKGETESTISLASNVDITGTIDLKTPRGATFVAVLTNDGDDTDAIAFLQEDADGNKSAVTTFEKEIDDGGDPIEFKITTTQSAPSNQNTAKLTLLVRFANKTTKLIEDFGEWTIIQPAGQTSGYDFNQSSGGDSGQSSSSDDTNS